jgi:hypothetical protein
VANLEYINDQLDDQLQMAGLEKPDKNDIFKKTTKDGNQSRKQNELRRQEARNRNKKKLIQGIQNTEEEHEFLSVNAK